MSLQFVVGPVRSGKTTYIYEKMIQESLNRPDEEFFFLVPDQSTLNAQRQLVTRHPSHGTMNIDVVGFYRLAYRVFEELSYVPKELLEDEGKSMVIRKVMEQHKGDLKVFSGSMKKQGFIEELKSFFAEIYQYNVSKEQLETMLSNLEHPGLEAKLQDILFVMNEFEEYIGDKYLVSEQLLDVLCTKVAESNKLKEAIIYIDGFTGFTPIQRKVLSQLMTMTKKIVITLCADQGEMNKPYKEYELFAMAKQEKKALVELAKEQNVIVEEDVYMGLREEGSKELRHLERQLFRYPIKIYDDETKDILLQQGLNVREEAYMTARRIVSMVRDEGYAYNDIVVLTADLDTYQSELERSFQDMEIPYFVDTNHKLKNNPCVETILSALRMIQMDFSYEMVFRYLKSGFSCLSMDEADFLENYVLATGIRGFARWNRPFEKGPFSEEEISYAESLRIQFINEITPLKEGLKKRGAIVLEKLTCLYEFMEQIHIYDQLQKQKEIFEEEGNLVQAKTYARLYDQLIDFMDHMAEILGEEKLSFDDFLSVLESGITDMTMGVIPPSLDQVLVGDMERTRTEGVKVLFFLGINDGVIPKLSSGAGVINDQQREVLKEKGIALAPTTKMNAYTEQFYLYLTLAKPEDKLILSYRTMGQDGKAIGPSYMLGRIQNIFPKMSVLSKNEQLGAYTVKGAVDELIHGLQEVEEHENILSQLKVLYASLKEIAPVASYLDGKFYHNGENSISQELVEKLFGTKLTGSVTRMEQFAGCAFAHFMRYGLRLKERMEHKILPMDMGQVFHKTMELVGKEADWKFSNEEERDAFVDQKVEEAIGEVQKDILTSSKRNEYTLERMKRISRRAVWAMETYIKRGDFKPKDYEVAFDPKADLSSMTFALENGKEMTFQGVVDRLDSYEDDENQYIRIIDYKSGDMKFDFGKIFHGLQMQLIIYMNAMLEVSKKDTKKKVWPAGMFYFRFDDPILNEDENHDADIQMLDKLKLRGVANQDFHLIDIMEVPDENGYLSLPVKKNKNGEFSRTSSVLNTTQMQNLGKMVERKVKDLGNHMMSGDISILPYAYENESPCTYCSYRNICGFDPEVDPVQKINKIKLEEGQYALDQGTTESN